MGSIHLLSISIHRQVVIDRYDSRSYLQANIYTRRIEEIIVNSENRIIFI